MIKKKKTEINGLKFFKTQFQVLVYLKTKGKTKNQIVPILF